MADWDTLTEAQRDTATYNAARQLSRSGEGEMAEQAAILIAQRFSEWGKGGIFLPQGAWWFSAMTKDEVPELARQLHAYWRGVPFGESPSFS
jgi:hypothetical protein